MTNLSPILLLILLMLSCVREGDYPRIPEFYEKYGTLYVQWADGKTEIYEGKFRDYPDKVILLNASLVKLDTLVSDTLLLYPEDLYPEATLIDSLTIRKKMKYRYLQIEYIKAMRTSLMKAQMKRVWIE